MQIEPPPTTAPFHIYSFLSQYLLSTHQIDLSDDAISKITYQAPSPDIGASYLGREAANRYLSLVAIAFFSNSESIRSTVGSVDELRNILRAFFSQLYKPLSLTVSETIFSASLLLQYLSTLPPPGPKASSLLDGGNYGTVFLCSLILSLKMLRDRPIKNTWWANLFNFPVVTLNHSERLFLIQVDNYLHTSSELFNLLTLVLFSK
ncbi:hypothetical protein BLNAU_10920 [Blattamonas nauphoetae]|uniref:Uncharacterized protein n=1 Tax=Blattamonas nauphoetae TaxID=2049346 RepID=A0ABQ9XNV8_9EUKA|nr:hypothetical protein BLNAU_10920 [Blattamonas nauphoetae]